MKNMHESQPLVWRFVLIISGTAGLAFGGLTIFGWIHGWERYVALAILAVVALLVVRRGMHRPVRHGFATGFFFGLFAAELQAVFLPLYFTNNPEYALIEMPLGLSPRLATALGAPIPATIAGLLTAGIVWLLGKLWKKNTSASAT